MKSFQMLQKTFSNWRNCLYIYIYIFNFMYVCIYLAVLGLHGCLLAFSSCGERGLLFFAVLRLLTAVASLVVEHGL